MLRRGLERRELLPAERQEDAARRVAERRDGLGDVVDQRPAIAVDRLPGGTAQREERHAGQFGAAIAALAEICAAKGCVASISRSIACSSR